MACVYIPVQNSEEEVRVALDQLPRDASDILDILKAEQAPLDLWLIIAVRLPSLMLNLLLCGMSMSIVLGFLSTAGVVDAIALIDNGCDGILCRLGTSKPINKVNSGEIRD